MLTDQSVSQNILPGVCKSLEKFILVYELDAIMKITGWKVLEIGGKIAGSMIGTAAFLSKTKNESELLEAEPMYPIPPLKGEVINRDRGDRKKSAVDNIFGTIKSIKDLNTTEVNMPNDSNSLSLEPTYLTVTTSAGTRIIGIKVIPFPVKTKEGYTLADLLTADASLNYLDSLLYKISRKAIRAFWALCRAARVIPFLSDRVLSGDPEKDILWASSFHKRYVYCLLNYSDMDTEFFRNAGGIHKLHGVGWNSIILADDVNKRAVFCMEEFHGLCSSVPYQFIYSSLGKEHSKIYDNLEDLKRSASPFFKTSLSSKKIFGEMKNTLKNYLNRIT